jgi:hypothetical protein
MVSIALSKRFLESFMHSDMFDTLQLVVVIAFTQGERILNSHSE